MCCSPLDILGAEVEMDGSHIDSRDLGSLFLNGSNDGSSLRNVVGSPHLYMNKSLHIITPHTTSHITHITHYT